MFKLIPEIQNPGTAPINRAEEHLLDFSTDLRAETRRIKVKVAERFFLTELVQFVGRVRSTSTVAKRVWPQIQNVKIRLAEGR
jgi:hypothetical protein